VTPARVTRTLLRLGIAGALLGTAAAPAAAWPVLDEARDVAGVRVLPDHEDPGLFWTVDDRVRMAQEGDGTPAFRFDRFRYTGRGVSGDRGTFRARGLIRFTVRSGLSSDELAAVEAALAAEHRRPVEIRPLPVEEIETRLVYATIGGDDAAGALGPANRGSLRDTLSFTVGLESRDADLLWSAYERDGVALSLHYAVVGRVLPTRPGRDRRASRGVDELLGEEEDLEDPTPEALPVAAGAVPVAVTPDACPSCFESLDLDAVIPAEYARLEVRCQDFTTGAAPDDLVQVLVEVRATAAAGSSRPFERLRFLPDGDTHAEARFPVAVRLDAGYEVRPGRVFLDGHVELDDWRPVESWAGLVDITHYVSDAATDTVSLALDPRELY
jgi:hypothetical protein